MTVQLRNLTRMTYGAGNTWWDYHTEDSQREVEGSGYWADAVDLLKEGDWILFRNSFTAAIYIVRLERTMRLVRLCDTKSTGAE